jgi:hypothetical protein
MFGVRYSQAPLHIFLHRPSGIFVDKIDIAREPQGMHGERRIDERKKAGLSRRMAEPSSFGGNTHSSVDEERTDRRPRTFPPRAHAAVTVRRSTSSVVPANAGTHTA